MSYKFFMLRTKDLDNEQKISSSKKLTSLLSDTIYINSILFIDILLANHIRVIAKSNFL